MARYISEFIGTFVLVLFGTGAIVVAAMHPGSLPPYASAGVFALAVMTMIYAIGGVSGAHINPAVTVAFWLARRFPGRDVLPYVLSQLLGATAASALLRGLYPATPTLGVTAPTIHPAAAFALEALLTFVLMFVIIHIAQNGKEKGIMAGIAVGGTVAVEGLVFGPITGASMNPARSLGPSLVAGAFSDLWIYLLAPTLGAALAVLFCRLLRAECCDSEFFDRRSR